MLLLSIKWSLDFIANIEDREQMLYNHTKNTVISTFGLVCLIIECYTSINLIEHQDLRNNVITCFTVLLCTVIYLQPSLLNQDSLTIFHEGHQSWYWIDQWETTYLIYIMFSIAPIIFWKKEHRMLPLVTFVTTMIMAFILNQQQIVLWHTHGTIALIILLHCQ